MLLNACHPPVHTERHRLGKTVPKAAPPPPLRLSGILRRDQRLHCSARGGDRGNQGDGLSTNRKGISHSDAFPLNRLLIVVYEGVAVAFPMRSTAYLAGFAHVVEARKEAVKLCPLVPPNDYEKIQSACGTIGRALLNQRASAGAKPESCGPLAASAIWEEFTSLHGFYGVPITREGPGQSVHFSVGAGLGPG